MSHTVVERSKINFRRDGDKAIKLDFTEQSGGVGTIHLYFAGKFVKSIPVNLTKDMEMVHH